MSENLIQENVTCEECAAVMEIHHNEVQDLKFCPFCRYETLIHTYSMNEDAQWADLRELGLNMDEDC